MFFLIRDANGRFVCWTRTTALVFTSNELNAWKFVYEESARKKAMELELTGFAITSWEPENAICNDV